MEVHQCPKVRKKNILLEVRTDGSVVLALEANSKRPTGNLKRFHGREKSSCPGKTLLDAHQQKGGENLKSQCGGKRKRNKKDKETTEFEVVRPSFGRERCRGRISCGKEIGTQQGMLDSATFQCYFENLWKSLPDEKRNSFEYLDCLWFSLYSKSDLKEKVLKWIKKKQIFSSKYVIVPIVRWHHWSLLIFCHMGGGMESSTSTPCMLLLDPLQKVNPKRLEPEIRKFVLDIYKTEERPETKKQIYQIPLMVPEVPQQRNSVECGNFVLYYINLFIEDAPEIFSVSHGYPYFMKYDWFTYESLLGFWKGLDSS